MTRKTRVAIHPMFPVGDDPDAPKAARTLLEGIAVRALNTMRGDTTVPGHNKAVEVVEGAAGPKSAA